MRTTLTIDDDVLAAVKELASAQSKSIGEVVSNLTRSALSRPAGGAQTVRNGILLLPVRPDGRLVTTEMVKQLEEELF